MFWEWMGAFLGRDGSNLGGGREVAKSVVKGSFLHFLAASLLLSSSLQLLIVVTLLITRTLSLSSKKDCFNADKDGRLHRGSDDGISRSLFAF